MHWQFTPYTLPLLTATAVSAALALLAWRRRSVPGAIPFALLMLAVVEWSLAYALELGSADLPVKVFWVKIEYLGIVTVSVMWLAFVLQYTGREKWLTRRNAALLAIVPLVTLLLIWTNDLHGLIWSDVRLDTSGFFPLLDLTYGAWWWAHAAYSYLLLLLGTLLLIQAFIRSPHLYRGQVSALLIGALVPWVGNVLYIFDLSPFPHLDLTPFAFTLTGLAVAWGLFRFRLLDIVPVARDAVIESMGDGVIVVDVQNRVVDLNPAAERVIGRTASEVIGQPINIADLGLRIADLEVQGFHSEIHIPQLVLSEAEVSAMTYDLRISPLHDRRGRLTGRLAVLRDITERKRAEETLARERRAFRIIAEAAVHTTDVSDLCHRVLTGLIETLGFEFGTIRLYDEEERLLQPTAVVGLSEKEQREKIPPQPLDDPRYTGALVARTRRAIFAPDVNRHEISKTHGPRLDELGIRSIISWPILGTGQSLLGVMQLVARTPKEIAGEDRSFFETVAGMFATVLERKQVEEEVHWRAETLSALHETALDLAAQRALPDLLQAIVARAVELLKAKGGGIYFYRPATDDLELALQYNLEPDFTGTVLERGEGLSGKVLETGRPMVVDDYGHWEGRSAQYEEAGFTACVAVPISWGDRLLGVLNVLDDAPRTFSPAGIGLLERFTPLAAAALEQTHVLEKERARRREAETLRKAGTTVTETLSLDERLERILVQLERVVPYDSASVQLLRDGHIEIVGGRGFPEPETVIGLRLPVPGDNPNTPVVVERKPVILADARAAHPTFRQPPHDHIRSWLGMPLIVHDQAIGILAVDSIELGHFNEEHVRLVTPFANQMAVAIENARLYEESQRRLREMNSLLEISRNVTATLELDEVLHRVIEAAITAIGPAEKGTLHLLDEEQEELAVRASVGFSPETVAAARFKPGEGYTGWVFAHQQPLIVRNVKADPRTKPIDLPEVYEEKSALCVPLIVRGRAIGTVTLDNVTRYDAFTPEHLDLLTIFASQAAVAIENARLFEDARQWATEMGILYEVATAAATSVHLDEVLSRTTAALQQTLRPDDIAILLLEPETNELVIRASTGFPGGPKLMRRAIGVGVPGWVVQTGQPLLLADVRGDERYHACDANTRSELCVPLQVGERVIGALNLESRRLAAFSEEDLHLVSILAGNLAAVIENARLFQEIEERRMYLERVLGAAPDAVITLDARHRVVEWNTGAEKLFGYSREEVIGRNPDDLVTSPDVLDEAIGLTQIVLSGREVPPVETVRYRKDGSPVDVIVAGSPILVEDELIGVVAVYTDITERKRAEEALRRWAAELDALQSTVLDITTPHDLPTLLQTIVERAARLLDAPGGGMYLCDPARRQVRCVVSYNTPHDYTGTVLKYGEGAAGIIAQTGEPLIIDDYRVWSGRAAAYEEEKPFTAVLSAPMIWQGQVTGVIHVLHNVESKHFTQADLQLLTLFADHAAIAVENTRLYEQAQKEIAERKRAEEALRQYAAELEARNEDLDAFAHTVAHDLKNPLGIITGFAQVLEEDYATLPDGELRRYLHTMAQSGHKMSSIINELLLLAGVRQMEVEMSPLDMASIVAEARQRLAHEIEEHQAEIILPETWPVALGYGPWVEEVWVNYLSNAIKYGGRPPRVELGATAASPLAGGTEGGQIRFWIRDNGPGLAPEEQAHLFTPFTQLDQAGKGHGLGLSIVLRIVEKLGGQVGVESEVGQGSVFTFTLPGIASQDNSLLSG